jgi:hypothetical protein
MNDIILKDEPLWDHKVESETGGKIKVVFGKAAEKIGKEYTAFVKSKNILNNKLSPETGQMYQGFNCASI